MFLCVEVTVDQTSSCEHCSSSLVELVLHKDKIGPNESPELHGCIVCDETLNKLFEGK